MTAARQENRSIRFELLVDDLVAFNKFQLSHSPVLLRQRRLGYLLPPVIWLAAWSLIVMLSEDPEATAGKLWWLLLYAPVHFMLHHWRSKRNQDKLLEKLLRDGAKSPLLGKRKLTFTALKLSEQNPVSEISAEWAQVLKIERVEAHTFLFLSPVAAIIIPKRAFEKELEYAGFVDFAQQCYAAVSSPLKKGAGSENERFLSRPRRE